MVHTFSKVFRSRKWAREIGQKPGETLFGKEMPENASRHPKSYPQTRQDTVVGVFPMESSN